MAEQGLMLDDDEILEAMETALARIQFFADHVDVPQMNLSTMQMKGNA